MKALLPVAASGALVLSASSPGAPAVAKDYGQYGESWSIAEPDLLSQIKGKLETLEDSGELDRLNQRFAARVRERVARPEPLPGIATATADRVWLHDPSITLAADMKDAAGRVIFPAGTRVNPLDHTPLEQTLYFVNGDDPAQLQWAIADSDNRLDKIIFVAGSPFEQMRAAQRRFYFDQGGVLTTQFSIRATPAKVERDGNLLKVSEVVLRSGGS